jgi:hypothetical protein
LEFSELKIRITRVDIRNSDHPPKYVFDSESKAYEESRSLQQLDGDGSIAVYAARVVAKNPDGTAVCHLPIWTELVSD